MDEWYLSYIGKPWQGIPNPPYSYTCGELVRSIYKDRFGVDIVPIPVADANSLRATVCAMRPEYFDLEPIPDGEGPQEFDAVFMARRSLLDHCGILAMTSEGLRVLHCSNPAGVVLDTLEQLREQQGFTEFHYYRHPGVHRWLEGHRHE